ncbi:Hypothetical predicted protein [Scomber scombrus]|uniref:Uncharacterized protein n=1 Tax=Scomber scombrus TaxID=13677 RepID=A0AAV1PDG5_SCOSC
MIRMILTCGILQKVEKLPKNSLTALLHKRSETKKEEKKWHRNNIEQSFPPAVLA